jgi:hypothetical protein
MTTITSQTELEVAHSQYKKLQIEQLALNNVYIETLNRCHELRIQGIELAQRVQDLTADNFKLNNELNSIKKSVADKTKDDQPVCKAVMN